MQLKVDVMKFANLQKRTIAHIISLIYVVYILIRKIFVIKNLSYFLWFLPNYISLMLQGYFLLSSLRQEPKEKNESLYIFIIAVVSANFPGLVAIVCNYFAISDYNISLAYIAYIINFFSMIFYVYAIMSLGRSLTVLPEYNVVKTQGAYKYSRHPLYLVYIIQYITQIFIFQTWSIILCSIIQISLILIRAKHEEKILSENDSIYKKYIQETKWVNIKLGGRKK